MLENYQKLKIKKLKNQKRKIKKYILSKIQRTKFNNIRFVISPFLNKLVHSRKKNVSQCLLINDRIKVNRMLAWKKINSIEIRGLNNKK
mmetsp:Transcript_25810/g.41501  ORF Transcript_25810/g.41501 Transcript_25810/m.41501 type:complete len:89 (+) Transcript_25810:360-626(+)